MLLIRQVDDLECANYLGLDFFFRDVAPLAQGEGDILAHAQGIEERTVLEQHAGLLAQGHHRLLIHLGEVAVAEPDLAGIGPHQAEDVLEQHALTAAASPDDDHVLALANLEVHPTQDVLDAERLLHIDDAKQGLGGG